MERTVITCENCGQAYSVRVRDDDTYVLPTETGECERCGSAEFSQVTEKLVGDD